MIGTIAKSKFTYSHPASQKTVPVSHSVKYCINNISINPELVTKEDMSKCFWTLCPLNLSAEFTRIELDRKNIRKGGRYIGMRSSVSGLKIRTPKKINL